jgi:glycosyltransferase involved in cell wall biosynthesis
MLARAVSSAARIVTPSTFTKRELASFAPRAEAKAVVVPNGIDEPFRSAIPASERARVRSAYALPRPFVFFAGNDKPHKNLGGLLDAFARLPPGLALVLAGGARERASERRADLERRGLSSRVLDLGVVPDADLPPLMAEAAALALPSLAEGFGLPVVEAQALGTPVVCSDRGALPETAGGAALLCDPESPDSIAAALLRAVSDEKLRVRLIDQGLSRTRGLSWGAAGAALARIYREVLEETA